MRLATKILLAVAFLSCSALTEVVAAIPTATIHLPGYSCDTLGMTQLADDKVSLIACLKTSATDSALIWKPMTPVYGLPNGNVGIGTTSPGTKLDVGGDVKIGQDSTGCSSSTAGTMRYNSSTKIMEYCNGTGWATMRLPYEKMTIVSSNYSAGAGTKSVYCPSGYIRVGCTLHSYTDDGKTSVIDHPPGPINPNGCGLYSEEDDDLWAVDAYCIPSS